MRFLPKESLAFPRNGAVVIVASRFALSTHPAVTRETLNEEVICGNATATAVELIKDMSAAQATKTKSRYLTIYSFPSWSAARDQCFGESSCPETSKEWHEAR